MLKFFYLSKFSQSLDGTFIHFISWTWVVTPFFAYKFWTFFLFFLFFYLQLHLLIGFHTVLKNCSSYCVTKRLTIDFFVWIFYIQRITEKQNKVVITDRMWARLLASTNQPSFLNPKDVIEVLKEEEPQTQLLDGKF